MIKVENINKIYKNGEKDLFVLNGVTVEFEVGKINTILGPSGSGKTTLLNVLSGLDTVDSGNIIINDINIAKLSEKQLTNYRRKNTGYIFQDYNLISTLTLYENIELAQNISDNPIDINEIIKEMDLEEHINKYPHQLSGGQKQRTAIARVVVKNPKVIFCDEPTGALDEVNGRNVLQVLENLNSKYKTTIVMVTHNINIAEMSDKVIYFKNGNISKEVENINKRSSQEIDWSWI